MSELDTAKRAQARLTEAHTDFMDTVNMRDAAAKKARLAGVSARQLATHLGLSRQQVHKILKGE